MSYVLYIFFMLHDHLIIGMQIGSSTLVYTKLKLHLFFVAYMIQKAFKGYIKLQIFIFFNP